MAKRRPRVHRVKDTTFTAYIFHRQLRAAGSLRYARHHVTLAMVGNYQCVASKRANEQWYRRTMEYRSTTGGRSRRGGARSESLHVRRQSTGLKYHKKILRALMELLLAAATPIPIRLSPSLPFGRCGPVGELGRRGRERERVAAI